VSAPLSVALVCYPSFGGSGIVASELAVGLAKRGHRIHVIASAPPRRGLPASENLHFHEIAVSKYPLFDYPPYTLAVASAIMRLAGRERLDLVHVHYAIPHTSSAYLAAQALGANSPRIVATLHGTDVTRVGVDPNYEGITRFTAGQADGISVPSQFLKRETERWLALPESPPIEVIGNFVDTQRFAPVRKSEHKPLSDLFLAAGGRDEPTGPILFHVSNFRPIKRVRDVIEVLARVRKRLPARLILVGDGPERAPAAQLARELGVEASVCFLGKRTEFVEYLAQADGFLLPSESEGFGLAALEALSCGVPVFGYTVGGLPEVVTADEGRLVAPFHVDALADAVVEVLAAPALQSALGAAGRQRALTQFQSAPALERYERFYRAVLAAPSRRRAE
jgi:L-malate glycosyltransferase